ncbi:unnamed protein product [Closterium sp. NIES-54]
MRAAISKASLWPRIMGMLDSQGCVQRFVSLRCASHPNTVTHIQGAWEFKEKASEGGCSQMCAMRTTGHTPPRSVAKSATASDHWTSALTSTRAPSSVASRVGRAWSPSGSSHSRAAMQPPTCPASRRRSPPPSSAGGFSFPTRMKSGVARRPPHSSTPSAAPLAAELSSQTPAPMPACPSAVTASLLHLLTLTKAWAFSSFSGAWRENTRNARSNVNATSPAATSAPTPSTSTNPASPAPNGVPSPAVPPCDCLPCDQRCEKRLSCGHQCPSLCAEKSPSHAFCTAEGCGSRKKREMRVDLITWETLGEIDPNESPVLVLPCQDAFTVESFNGYLGLTQVYQESEDAFGGCSAVGGGTEASAGKWVAVRPFEGSLTALKRCPDCRQPITSLRWYGRMVKRALLDESEHKFALCCTANQQQLQHKLSTLSQALLACPENPSSRQLEELVQAATFLMEEASKVRGTALDPPTLQAYQACVAAPRRKHLRLGSPSFRVARLPMDLPAGSAVSA